MARSSLSPGVETKVATGSTVTIVSGYIAWALITYVPGLKNTFPPDLQGQLPVIVAFALSSLGAYLAPHTPRPDLPPLVLPASSPSPVGSSDGQPAVGTPDVPHV